jgi:glycosyltransferase involved in cell wall biosynthesis
MNIIIRAPLLSVSGYGVHSRQIFKWLDQRKDVTIFSQVVPWGNTSWMINSEDRQIKRIVETSMDLDKKADISFQVQLPDEWDSNLAKKNIGVSAFIETDRCNPSWIESVNKMDLVIVPSVHVRDIILSTGKVTTDLIIIPEWYFEEIDRDEIKKLDLNLSTKFNFLTIAQFTGHDAYTDRKNLFFTLKWFCETFSDDPDVGLILKTNHGRGTQIDRQLTMNKIRQVISEVRRGKYPKIHLLHGNLSPSEIAGLYNHKDVKCFLSLTRGEGFGLPLLEASACALPVMTTNWSAHLDFLNLGKFIPINYSLIEIPDEKVDNRIFLNGMKWAQPLEDDFKKKVLKFRNRSDIPKKWAQDLSRQVRSKFTASTIMLMYDDALDRLLE